MSILFDYFIKIKSSLTLMCSSSPLSTISSLGNDDIQEPIINHSQYIDPWFDGGFRNRYSFPNNNDFLDHIIKNTKKKELSNWESTIQGMEQEW